MMSTHPFDAAGCRNRTLFIPPPPLKSCESTDRAQPGTHPPPGIADAAWDCGRRLGLRTPPGIADAAGRPRGSPEFLFAKRSRASRARQKRIRTKRLSFLD